MMKVVVTIVSIVSIILLVVNSVWAIDGDCNGDGWVDYTDLAAVADDWLTSNYGGDCNCDGWVDLYDMSDISGNWLEGNEMADYYIHPDGVDDVGRDGSDVAAQRWLTLGYAYGRAATGDTIHVHDGTYSEATYFYPNTNGKIITFDGVSGNRADCKLEGTAGQSYTVRASGNSLITFNDMVIDSDTNSSGTGVQINNTHVSLKFNNCFVHGKTIALNDWAAGGASARTLEIIDSDFTSGGTSHCIALTDMASLTISGNTTITAPLGNGLDLNAHIGKISIDDTVFITTTGYGLDTSGITGTIDRLSLLNSTFSSDYHAVRIPEYVNILWIENNCVTISTSDDKSGMLLGVDGPANANPHGMVIVRKNNIQWSDSVQSGHGILIGSGIDYGEISYNEIYCNALGSALNIGLVLKGEGNHVHHNIATGVRPLLLKGAGRSKIHNNTFRVTSNDSNSTAIAWYIDTDEPKHNIIENNILDAELGRYTIKMTSGISGGEAHGNNIFDYNCYVAGTLGLCYNVQDTETYADIAALRTQWAGWTDNVWTENDANSLEADPQFADVANNDYTPLNSEIWRGGKPDVNGNDGYMGAIKPYEAKAGAFAQAWR